ncbi:MAG: hypothetical protein J1G01_00740 [Clostridiales bacterium]|nr:hypothetical protein [Clostridiales bacterium]
MSMKKELAKEIRIMEEEIKELEIKRIRSMSAIIESIISKTEIGADEARFFRTYSAEIEVKREKLNILRREYRTKV